MKLLPLLLLVPLCAGAQEVGLPYFAADPSALTIDLCPSNAIALGTGTAGNVYVWNGNFVCQKIKNLSATPVTVKRFTAYAYHAAGTVGSATFVGYVRSVNTISNGTTYGSASITTNTIRSGEKIDMTWVPGTEPVIPALTDFYVGAVCTPNSETVYYGEYFSAGGTGYITTDYQQYHDGTGASTLDMPSFEVWACDSSFPSMGNLVNLWDSESYTQGKTWVWQDTMRKTPIVAVNTNDVTGYMYNTPDGMIMSSGVMGNDGAAKVASISLGTDWTVWMTVKREDLATTRKIFGTSSSAEVLSDTDWDLFFNMASPMRIAPSTDHYVARWTDIAVVLSNNATYYAYYDGVYMTNQPLSVAMALREFGTKNFNWPNQEKIGQIAWWNKVLTPTEITNLHTRMVTNMLDNAATSNALPTIAGLRNAWRTAGYVGRWPGITTWTDSLAGKSFTAVFAATSLDNIYVATGRGLRNWSSESGVNPINGWKGGDMVFPSTYTMFLTFTPTYVSHLQTANLIFTSAGVGLYYGDSDNRLRWDTGGGHILSPPLTLNRPHTVVSVWDGTSGTFYIDGAYYTNITGAGFPGYTLQSYGTLFFSPYNTWSGNFNGYLGEFLLSTSQLSTNDAVDYHTYATNQYGFDYYGGSNAYGGYFTTPVLTSNLWTTPILQQQTNHNDYGSSGGDPNWQHQKIHNTSSTSVRIKAIRSVFYESGSGTGYVYGLCTRTNYSGEVPTPKPEVGGMGYYTSTNTLTLNAPIQWLTFVYADVDTPVIPANTDFFIHFKRYGAGTIVPRYQSGSNPYESTTYNFMFNSDDYASAQDMTFEIYIAP